MNVTRLVLVPILMLLAGCAEAERLSTVERELDSLTAEVAEAHRVADSLRMALRYKEVGESSERFAYLDPARDAGFVVLQSSYGPLTFAVDDVTSQADGSRVVLQIGNPTSATISGGTLSVQWGPRHGEDQSVGEWLASLQDADIQFNEDLRPGAWNLVRLSLAGTPPSQLGHLRIAIKELPTISLQRR